MDPFEQAKAAQRGWEKALDRAEKAEAELAEARAQIVAKDAALRELQKTLEAACNDVLAQIADRDAQIREMKDALRRDDERHGSEAHDEDDAGG